MAIEELLGFNPPETDPLPDDVIIPFTNKIKGRTLGGEYAMFVSRYGNTDYKDHPLQWLRFSNDGKKLSSHCPGPNDSDASVAGPFQLKEIDSQGNYVIELLYGCRTTYIVKKIAVDGEESEDSIRSERNDGTAPTQYIPELATCQREGCPQRHRTRFLKSFADYDELSGERKIGDLGVIQLKRCSGCRQVHDCSVACQKKDWRRRHRDECRNFGTKAPPDVDVSSTTSITDLKAVLMHIFQSCITTGEERNWGPEGIERAREVGRRLYAIGGFDLCVSVCDDLRVEIERSAGNEKCKGDARALEYFWADPTVPGWWP